MLDDMGFILADVHHGDHGYFSPIVADTQAIMDTRFKPRLNQIIQQELKENGGKTGLDFVGAKKQLLVQYKDETKRFRETEMEPIEFLAPKPTKAEKIHYQELLFSELYLAEKLSMTTAERELDKLLTDVIRDLVRCAECTTTPIVKTVSNSYTSYAEISLAEWCYLDWKGYQQEIQKYFTRSSILNLEIRLFLLSSFFRTFALISNKTRLTYLYQKTK